MALCPGCGTEHQPQIPVPTKPIVYNYVALCPECAQSFSAWLAQARAKHAWVRAPEPQLPLPGLLTEVPNPPEPQPLGAKVPAGTVGPRSVEA